MRHLVLRTLVGAEALAAPGLDPIAGLRCAVHLAPIARIVLGQLIEPVNGVDGPGIILKPGFEAIVRNDILGTTSQGDDKGGLDALGWDWDADPIEDDAPLPPLDWTDEDRAEQIEHWRSRPESWAKLHEVSRQCLLRAMGVERL